MMSAGASVCSQENERDGAAAAAAAAAVGGRSIWDRQ